MVKAGHVYMISFWDHEQNASTNVIQKHLFKIIVEKKLNINRQIHKQIIKQRLLDFFREPSFLYVSLQT